MQGFKVKKKNKWIKMWGENFILHPVFLVFGIFACVFGNAFYFFSFLLAILVHEYAHYFVARQKGVVLKDFKLMPYGALLNLKNSNINFKDDILIAVAGPVTNLFFVILGVCFWWLFPEIYPYTEFFVYSNFCLAFFNLMPILPLDGSRVVLALASAKGKRIKVFKFLKALNLLVASFLFLLFIFSLFSTFNLNLGISAFFILFSAFEGEDKFVYESLLFSSKRCLEKNKPLPIKFYCVNAESDVSSLFKLLNPNYYVGVIVFSGDKIKRVIMQKDFEQLVAKGDENGKNF